MKKEVIISAPTAAQALAKVKQELGIDAVIVDQEEHSGHVHIKATTIDDIKASGNKVPLGKVDLMPKTVSTWLDSLNQSPSQDTHTYSLKKLLDFHSCSPDLQVAFAHFFANTREAINQSGLAEALHSVIRHESNWLNKSCSTPGQIVLLGSHGSGKTVCVAKLAALFLDMGKSVEIVSLDLLKSSGIEQLQSYLAPLDLTLHTGVEALRNVRRDAVTLIDTPGINFHNPDECLLLTDPALAYANFTAVLPADVMYESSLDILPKLQSLGVEHFIATKTDLSHRLGSILSLAHNGLSLALLSNSPVLADGFVKPNLLNIAGNFITFYESSHEPQRR